MCARAIAGLVSWCVSVCGYMCVCVCIYIDIYICMYVYTHTHTHTHMYVCGGVCAWGCARCVYGVCVRAIAVAAAARHASSLIARMRAHMHTNTHGTRNKSKWGSFSRAAPTLLPPTRPERPRPPAPSLQAPQGLTPGSPSATAAALQGKLQAQTQLAQRSHELNHWRPLPSPLPARRRRRQTTRRRRTARRRPTRATQARACQGVGRGRSPRRPEGGARPRRPLACSRPRKLPQQSASVATAYLTKAVRPRRRSRPLRPSRHTPVVGGLCPIFPRVSRACGTPRPRGMIYIDIYTYVCVYKASWQNMR